MSVPVRVDRAAAEDDAVAAVERALASAADSERAARHRQRLAWTVLWLSAALFCGLFVAVVVGANWYREQSLSPRQATLEIIGTGTVLYQPEEAVRETAATGGMRVQDGDRIRTPADGQALLSLPDGSNVRLWPFTEVQVRQIRSSTFTSNHAVVLLNQTAGHTRIEVAAPSTHERRFEIQTPQGRALLREGSYRIEVGPLGTDLSVRTGSASVTARDQAVEVIRGERTLVGPNGRPSPPARAERNLIRNGELRSGFEGWQQGSRNEEDGIAGRVSLVEQDGRYAVRMPRQGSQKHGETFLQQQINRDVTDESRLRLQMDVKVASHTLSGGGWRGSEYPLLLRLKYRDAYGSETTVVRGFYVRNPDGHPTTNGTQVTANQWLPLTLDLFDEKVVSPRPAHLLWIEVESAGWDYEAFVTGIQLLAE